MRQLRFALAIVAGLTLIAIAIALIATSEHEERKWLVGTLAVTAAVSFIAAGLVAVWRRPENATGFYLAATGYIWFLGALTEANDSWPWTVGVVTGNLALASFIALILAYPDGALERRDRWLVALGGMLALGGNLAAAMVDRTPVECADCPTSAIAVIDSPRASDTIQIVVTILVVPLLVAVGATLVGRWRRATTAARRLLAPVYGTCALALVLILATLVANSITGSVHPVLWALFLVCFAAVPLAFLYGVLRARLARSHASDFVVALQDGTPIQMALARVLGDPTVGIAYRLAGTSRWVDPSGRRVDEPAPTPGRSIVTVDVHGLPIAAIVHDPSLDDALVRSLAAAAGLALQNERLQAEARSQLEFMRQVTDTTPSLIVNLDTAGRILNQNRAAVAAAGYSDEEEVRGRFFWDVFIDAEERQDVIDRFEALAPTFDAGEYENTFTNARGEQLVVSWRSAPILDGDGTVVSIVAGGIDITERHRLEEEKERERRFLSTIAYEAPSLLCLVDADGVVAPTSSSREFEETLEYAHDEIGGEVFWERYVEPEEAADVARRILSVARGDTARAVDSTWVTKTGRMLTVSWSCTRLPPIDERRLLLVSGVDVTERRQRELDVERERDATTTVLQAIPGVIAVLDRTGRIRDRDEGNPLAAVNQSFREILGWTDEELVDADFLELIVAEDDAAREAVEAAAAGRTSGEVESRWRARDGRLVSVSWTASPVVDVTGRRDGLVLVSGVDVTERKQRELEDERRRAFIDAITATIPSYLVVVHPDGTIRADGVNEAFEQRFGWTASEIAGGNFVGCVTPESDVAAKMLIANAAGGESQGEIESRWDARDGDSRIVAWTARPVTALTGELLVLVTGNDVTVRRLQEEELRASRQRIVAAADEARRRLERNLHDGAQQRLVALSVSLRLAESRLATDPESARVALASAREELAHALEELRELARGIHPAVLTDRGLGPAIEALVNRSPVPVEAVIAVGPLEPAVEAAVYYVIAEALTNVAKYAHAQHAEVHVEQADAVVCVTVSDDGVGGADSRRGSGLRGLADRVAALEGTLSIDSPAGAGTCVRAEIPVTQSVHSAP